MIATALLAAMSMAQRGAADDNGGRMLDRVAAAFAASSCWRTEFQQRYVPAGFETGASEDGTLIVAPPASLRFEYEGETPRLFATDGAVARHVDLGASTCSAVRLDATTWGRLPLAAMLDPGAARAAFILATSGRELTMTPREATPELARADVTVDDGGLPQRVTIMDGSGNRNEFTFASWDRCGELPEGFFRPALPGLRPCEAEQE